MHIGKPLTTSSFSDFKCADDIDLGCAYNVEGSFSHLQGNLIEITNQSSSRFLSFNIPKSVNVFFDLQCDSR